MKPKGKLNRDLPFGKIEIESKASRFAGALLRVVTAL